MMGTYTVYVTFQEKHVFENCTYEEAEKIGYNVVRDNYGNRVADMSIYDVERIDIPQYGDLADAGMDGA